MRRGACRTLTLWHFWALPTLLLQAQLIPHFLSLPFPKVDAKNQGSTALQIASYQGHLEVVKALLQAHANVDLRDDEGDTALHYAAFG